MKTALGLICVILLVSCYCVLLLFVIHPKVNAEYRAYYIERTSVDWNPPRYSATPEQGINFAASGLPTFVRYLYGFSFREPWGRWTDADHGRTAGIVLKTTLSAPVCVNFRTLPADWQKNKSLIVALDHQEKTVPFVSPDYYDYYVDFPEIKDADTLEFRLSNQFRTYKSQHPWDPRKLGIAMVYLRFLRGSCIDAQRQLKPAASKRTDAF